MVGRKTLAALALASTAIAGSADAAIISKLYTITASNFVNGFGSPVPIDPVTLSFTLTFDSSSRVFETGTGIQLVSSNLAIDSPLAFEYLDPSLGDVLSVGGQLGGAIYFLPAGSNDFFLSIFGATSSAPWVNTITYTQAGSRGGFHTSNTKLTISSVPEPTSWALMIAGFGLAGLGLRHRRCKAVAGMA